MRIRHSLPAMTLLAATSAVAADMLPLRQGIYVPADVACKGASNADMVNYWGGKSSIGSAQGHCTVNSMKKVGITYTLSTRCKDIESGRSIVGDPMVLRIASQTNFEMGGVRYRYCGPRPTF